MSFINYFLLFLFLIRSLKVILFHLAWWEIKEYRLDRMLVHLKETTQGRKMFFNPLSIFKLLLLLYLFLSTQQLKLILLAVYLLEVGKYFLDSPFNWKLPSPRVRIAGIFIGTLTMIFAVFLLLDTHLTLKILILDRLTPLLILGFIILSNLIFNWHKKRTLALAKNKLRSSPQLKVIGVTGSYGKTTTKEFIYTLLSSKYRTAKTRFSQNTDIGVAERVLQLDLNRLDWLVVEMAAYKRGEIAEIANMFADKIKVGVITGINEQHQSLFHSLAATMKAKYELIESLNTTGTGIFNAENKYVKKLSDQCRQLGKTVVLADSKNISLPAHIKAPHFKENLSLALSVAKSCGMNSQEITAALARITLPDKTMDEKRVNNNILIDDTFNANPDGVYVALDYLKDFSKKKVLVLQPLIELGKYAGVIHEKIGIEAAEICDQVILTNTNFNKYFLKGFIRGGGNLANISYYPYSLRFNDSVVLFEGKEATKLLDKQLSKN